MPKPEKDLGKLLSTHPLAPAQMQRAAVVAVVSFLFFLAMLIAFYIRQHIGYFALSSAFLVVYIFTMIGWVLQRRSVVNLHEGGLRYRKFRAAWDEIEAVNADGKGLSISKSRRDMTVIPSSIVGYERIVHAVRRGVEGTP